MGKPNPKHQKKTYQPPSNVQHYKRVGLSRRHILMITVGSIIAVAMVAITIVVINREENPNIFVEVGDNVEMRYTLWLSNEEGTKVERLNSGEFSSDIKDTAKETGLIYGYWEALLGMQNGSIDEVWLPACIDDAIETPEGVVLDDQCVAGDDWDDRYPPGQVRAKSYGGDEAAAVRIVESEESGEDIDLRFKDLVFRIEILNIVKGDFD
ncbi:MAG: hypothetical protein GF364_05680 [Candidatus Lokiarchaeota archaeon]|nr:hypothetical protein [Candidatus Lokiarchaeota archaeon]